MISTSQYVVFWVCTFASLRWVLSMLYPCKSVFWTSAPGRTLFTLVTLFDPSDQAYVCILGFAIEDTISTFIVPEAGTRTTLIENAVTIIILTATENPNIAILRWNQIFALFISLRILYPPFKKHIHPLWIIFFTTRVCTFIFYLYENVFHEAKTNNDLRLRTFYGIYFVIQIFYFDTVFHYVKRRRE